jgi:hypothetical protein
MKKGQDGELKKLMQRMETGELVNQPCWSCIKELNSISEERLDSVALSDSYRQYPITKTGSMPFP